MPMSLDKYVVTPVAALLGIAVLYRKQKNDTERKNLEALNTSRLARLEKAKEDFDSQTFDLEKDLYSRLSDQAEVATVKECKSLPPMKQSERFYSFDIAGSNYAHWTDRVWNKDVLSFPQIIVRVAVPSDVAVCFELAKKHNLNISVAAGCHSANAFTDSALTIDMAKMTDMSYTAETKELQVQAGATLSAVDDLCRTNGRVLPVGTNGDTGISGLTLSGGGGWLTRKFGFTVDNLVGIDIVLPSGTLIENIRDSSPAKERDLLWACRGSGGHFGVVTKFYFKTHEMPNQDQFLLGTIVSLCPTATMKQTVLKAWWQKLKTTSHDTTCTAVLPAAPVVPLMWLHCGPEAPKGIEATKTVKDLQAAVAPVAGGGLFNVENSWKVVDHKKVQSLVADNQTHGFIYQTMIAIIDMSDDVIACMVDAIGKAPSGSVFVIQAIGGRASELDTPDCKQCSLSTRHAAAWILVEARWDPLVDGHEVGRAKASAWAKQFVADINEQCGPAMAKTSHAFSDAREENAGEGNNVLVDVTKSDVAKRLMEIKKRVDPDNILCHNRKLSSN
ncbi:unnamed protein product [Cylindrotheca closterium]|uniref:FAD-binding PCMH-type domain-containing protein n=1 Tax=Cylindrotheca closterium TaxID=2856 RepID=A0AAD2FSB2_9STRA|nr:unnamed protein product [Cylindrotheca closterium]